MHPPAFERRHLERQIALARVVFCLLTLVTLVTQSSTHAFYVQLVLLGYLAAGLAVLWLHQATRFGDSALLFAVDLIILGFVILFTDSFVAVTYPTLFVAFAACLRWGVRRAIFLAAGVALAVILRALVLQEAALESYALALFCGGTFAAAAGLALLGDRYRGQIGEYNLLTRLLGMLQVEKGTAESLRGALVELGRAFDADKTLLFFNDEDLERIFLWTVQKDQEDRISPQSYASTQADGFLLNRPDVSVCWNALPSSGAMSNGSGIRRPGAGFAWDRATGRRLPEVPRIAEQAQQELHLRSLMSVTLEFSGEPVGRMFVCNGRRPWLPQDLDRLDRIVRHLGAPLNNLFLLRHMRARAVEGERSRISRDLHDGILQTLLSVDMQLDVLRRKAQETPERVAAGLGALQQTMRNETAELRRMVTDMRPVGVESADLIELMRGFAERFRNESGLALDLLLDGAALEAPDRVCRDLFQIYREALHNVKKHAHATHVVVKMWQDDSQVTLIVDDNGHGFSFAGRFTGDELERLRLGPISIKERARSVGGMVTVESTPGHGARLTVEVPLG
jgi:signal transduction histidine kinase